MTASFNEQAAYSIGSRTLVPPKAPSGMLPFSQKPFCIGLPGAV